MLFIFVVIIAFESAQKQRTLRTRECETKVKKTSDVRLLPLSAYFFCQHRKAQNMFFITNSRQNKQKERKTGFSLLETRKYWSSSPSRSRRRSSTRKTFSLFLSLSLCWEKIHSPRRHILCSVHTSQRSATDYVV